MSLTTSRPSNPTEGRPDPVVERGFEHSVEEGYRRLSRTMPNVLVTGAVGGMDVTVGVFALLLIRAETGSNLLGALGFTIGFIALVLARSELFTENFFVPIAAVVADRGRNLHRLGRLWGGTLLANWVAGCAAAVLLVAARPDLGPVGAEIGQHYIDVGFGGTAFASAVVAGALITLMTWMERSTEELLGKLVAAVSISFLLVAGELHHAVLAPIEMAVGLAHGGTSYGVLDTLGVGLFAVVGNVVGGVGLVTLVRLVQVGARKVAEEQHRPADAPPRHPE